MRADHRFTARSGTPNRPAPRGRPAPSAIARLHGAIGNRAVTSLLRQPAKPTGTQTPKPEAFKKAGLTTTSRVDGKTAALIEAALAESALLAPFLKDKLAKAGIAGKQFVVEDSDRDFDYHFRDWRKIRDNLSDKQLAELLKGYGGYFDRPKKTVHLRPRATLGHAVHEVMHKLSAAGFVNFWDPFVDEGMTQYFADCLLVEQGLPKLKDHKYGPQLTCAHQIVAHTDFDTVGRAFFRGEPALAHKLAAKLKISLGDLRVAILNEKLCQKL